MGKYLSNLSTTLSKLSNLASQSACTNAFTVPRDGITGDAARTIRSVIAATNSVWSFDSFNDSFRYWGDLLSQLDIPKVTEQ